MLKSLYQTIPEDKKVIYIASLRYWFMHDIVLRARGINQNSNKAEEMLDNLEKEYDKTVRDIFFTYSWEGITSSFLNQYNIEPKVMTGRMS